MTDAEGPALSIRGIVKAYGGCVANQLADDDVIEVAPGEIHALVGENGAGKSTLMKIVAGLVVPDGGVVAVFGRTVTGWSAAEAIEAGVGMVHQHFMLVPTLTVAENVVLGREPRRGLTIDLASARDRVLTLARETGLAVPPEARVGDLPVGLAQRVEILKTLHRGARILVLDEPTAVLSPPEVLELFEVLRKLAKEGTAIVIVTHKLAEVMALSKRVSVMRRGKLVRTFDTEKTSAEEIARAMVGRDVAVVSEERVAPAEDRRPVLSVRDLVVRRDDGTRAVDGVDFDVCGGEIVGVAGVEGNGQTELVATIAGLVRQASGSMRLDGKDIGSASVRERARLGLAHVPEDRQGRGLVLDLSVAENLVLGRLDAFRRFGLLDHTKIRAFAAKQIEAFDIRPADPDQPARALSGGNQQKIVVARELSRPVRALLAAQPTRGVDIGAIEIIHARIRAARDDGAAVLLVSAELSEILALADRVVVLFRGKIAATLARAEASAEAIGPFMMGLRTENEPRFEALR